MKTVQYLSATALVLTLGFAVPGMAAAPAANKTAAPAANKVVAPATATKAPVTADGSQDSSKDVKSDASTDAKPVMNAAAPAADAAPAAAPAPASAEIEIPKQYWPDKGITGKYDRAALQRGFQVYKEVCSACHAMKFLAYRDLSQLGYKPDEIKAIAAQYTISDGPGDDGNMFDRPGRPSDTFKAPFANEKAARFANGGALPPDMSLLVKAREDGENYIYAIVTGYGTPPAGFTLNPGMNYNKYFPGHQIAMPQPLTDNRVTYGDGTNATLDQEARDVVQFLAWASEPHMEERKQLGIKVILFLLAFAGIMKVVKRRVWANVK